MTQKHVPVLGLQASSKNPSNYNSTTLGQAIREEVAKAETHGFATQVYQVDMKIADVFDEAKEYLRRQHWDAVSIGGGIRGNPENTALLEKLVNTAASEITPVPKFLFPFPRTDVFKALARIFEL